MVRHTPTIRLLPRPRLSSSCRVLETMGYGCRTEQMVSTVIVPQSHRSSLPMLLAGVVCWDGRERRPAVPPVSASQIAHGVLQLFELRTGLCLGRWADILQPQFGDGYLHHMLQGYRLRCTTASRTTSACAPTQLRIQAHVPAPSIRHRAALLLADACPHVKQPISCPQQARRSGRDPSPPIYLFVGGLVHTRGSRAAAEQAAGAGR